MKLYVDSREPRFIKTSIYSFFETEAPESIQIEIKELEYGDFIYNNIVIERKEINDFYSSIIDGRLKNQKIKLVKAIHDGIHPYVLIHGKLDDVYHEKLTPRMYAGSIASLNEHGIHTIHVQGNNLGLIYEIIYALIRQYNKDKPLKPEFIEPAVSNYAQKCLMCINGVGEETAENIINKFGGNLSNYYQIRPEQLKENLLEVEGIGEKTATNIINKLYGG